MKFGKVLHDTSEYFPEKRFIHYKQLKKLLKAIASHSNPHGTEEQSKDSHSAQAGSGSCVGRGKFIDLLNQELHELNAYFIGQEEEMVMRLQALESVLNAAKPEEKLKYSNSLVHFHGDVVSLLHWGILNYAAIAKILKKHDKLMTGYPIRQSYLESVVHQPFYSTEYLERLAKRCEELIEELDPTNADRGNDGQDDVTKAAVDDDSELSCLKKMLYAIRTWRDLGDNAHTPSTVLPYSKPIPGYMKMTQHHKISPQKRPHPDDKTEGVSKIARATLQTNT